MQINQNSRWKVLRTETDISINKREHALWSYNSFENVYRIFETFAAKFLWLLGEMTKPEMKRSWLILHTVGWVVALRRCSCSSPGISKDDLVPSEGGSADVIKSGIRRRGHPGFPRWALRAITSVLIRTPTRELRPWQGRRQCEDGGAGEGSRVSGQGTGAASRSPERRGLESLLRSQERARTCCHLDFGHLASRTLRV